MLNYLEPVPTMDLEACLYFDEKQTHQKLVVVAYYWNGSTADYLFKRYEKLKKSTMTDTPTKLCIEYRTGFINLAGIDTITSSDGEVYYADNEIKQKFQSVKLDIPFSILEKQFGKTLQL